MGMCTSQSAHPLFLFYKVCGDTKHGVFIWASLKTWLHPSRWNTET